MLSLDLMLFRLLALTALAALAAALSAHAQDAEENKPLWPAPFGGSFNANFTIASDYSYAGISNSGRAPAYQVGLDWRSPDLLSDSAPLWIYVTAWGSNVWFPSSGEGVEVDLTGGVKVRPFDRKVKLDLGYMRTIYPGAPAELAYDFNEIHLAIDYVFDVGTWKGFDLNGRLRYSPNAFGNTGQSWNKRLFLTVPLPFFELGEDVAVKTYGSLGNFWVERFQQFGLPNPDYWFWQAGFLVHALGLDFNLAYTGTSIDYAGCGHTNYCAPRAFVSVTKVF